MSYYIAKVGVVKIKPEYAEQFGYFFNCEHEKVTDAVFESFLHKYYEDSEPGYYDDYVMDIRTWKHYDIKKEWQDKYITAYKDGIFTYGLYFNRNNPIRALFVLDFLDKLLPKLTEKVLESDSWYE